MILTSLALLALQTPADLPSAIPALRDWCAAPGAGSDAWDTDDGRTLHLRRGQAGCSLFVQPARGDDGDLARAVEETFAPAAEGWRPSRRRERMINEAGPTLWTEFTHPTAGSVLLIEPDQGQMGTVTLDIRAGD